ncbi:MAG: RNA-binding transcriptional accessory protein [Megasphaera sp.]|jgi:uncharacterized protein|nr:RNA-binding transcriptional accessory protein [Megasphaera sp.]MCH4187845.1 RNA-binding transcriptional accessory protein [Megasphaera sp.]
MTEDMMILIIANTIHVRPAQVRAALDLLNQGNTIPFIARYRKEATGVLDEVQLRQIKDQYEYEQALASRKETVRQSIIDQNQWTEELAAQLDAAAQLQDIEDIYLPYKPKKRTKASMARDAGLEPLADLFWNQDPHGPAPETAAAAYINETIPTIEDAIQGAANIIAERLSEMTAFRKYLRDELWKQAKIACTLQDNDTDASTMLNYADFSEHISHIPSHRILAINRGENQKMIKVILQEDPDKHMAALTQLAIHHVSPYSSIIENAAADSYKRLIFPQMEREIRNDLTSRAEKQAIAVFAENLRNLLLQPPFANQIILGLDPGYRTGCKAAVIDSTGAVLDYGTYHLIGSANQRRESAHALTALIRKHGVTLISIGNGTASYETEQFVSSLIHDNKLKCRYIITNEAGASIYSASDLAREELPDLDVTIRGAVSIARRIQDPLAEAVKITPQSIGVGQYQHDVNQKSLCSALDSVVESVVNYVGVDLNTASTALLQHISGLTSQTAANIVAYRNENGPFHNRQELLDVNRLGPATFTQCAGFLRIKHGQESLDNTSVHPESYGLAEKIIAHYGMKLKDLKQEKTLRILQSKLQMNAAPTLAKELHAGEPTIRDILEELRKPGRDARSEFPQPLTRKHILSLEELKIGTIVRGTVHNVVDFGAFVDFGLKTPGLIHRSELCKHPFRHPTEVIHVGDIVDAVIISVDAKRGRIGLSIKQVPEDHSDKT